MDSRSAEAEQQQTDLAAVSSIKESGNASSFNKCAACFKQFKQKAFFIEHMQKAGHSHHEPRCAHCKKHCRCLDALREHLLGPLAKKDCSQEFAKRGCSVCLDILESAEVLAKHQASCQLTASCQHEPLVLSGAMSSQKRVHGPRVFLPDKPGRRAAVALDCEMVGGGHDGSFDLCARVCIVDENENILLNTYVMPELPVTDYRFQFTGVHPEDLVEAMPIKLARKTVEKILYNGVKSWASKQNANLLVGHSLHHDLNCLGIEYPAHLQRDTAFYPPLLRTSNVCNKLQYLTSTYLGYRIQEGEAHDPYEDAVAAMRLYKRMRMAAHPQAEGRGGEPSFSARKTGELEAMSPEELLELSSSRFQCWCLDASCI